MMAGPDWHTYLKEHQPRFLDELLDFLRIPSISALPEHASDVGRAAEWVARRLDSAGLEAVQILPTHRHPVVYGEWLHAGKDRPTVLIYGHFDTQPVDPLDLWQSPPFEPEVREDRVYARGASDDKGNMLVPVLAAEALLKTAGSLPVNLKFFLEGEEEIGSQSMRALVQQHRELFACDLIFSADGGQWAEDQPSLSVARRGILALQIDLRGPDSDLHSGVFGGAVHNPIHALVQLLATMRAADGRIAVPGFYDHVAPLTDEIRARLSALPYDEEAYRASVGVSALQGEAGYTALERSKVRPTLEINGIAGGFQGSGVKAIVPSSAQAKITCRLVPDQKPDEVFRLIAEHVAARVPPGVEIETTPLASSPAYLTPIDHPGHLVAEAVLTRVYGRKPYLNYVGGTIPVLPIFHECLGVHTVDFSFGLPDERLHAPNEFFRLSSFSRGQEAYCRLFEGLAKEQTDS